MPRATQVARTSRKSEHHETRNGVPSGDAAAQVPHPEYAAAKLFESARHNDRHDKVQVKGHERPPSGNKIRSVTFPAVSRSNEVN